MANKIYFIGGASASGKSKVTERLKKDFVGIEIIALDEIYNSLGAIQVESDKVKLTQEKAYVKIGELMSSGFSAIVEGGWISPSKATELKNEFGDRFHPVFCGYPNGNVNERVTKIVQDDQHWLKYKTPEYRVEWVEKQITGSVIYRSECDTYGISFFDFSNFEDGSYALYKNYNEWRGM